MIRSSVCVHIPNGDWLGEPGEPVPPEVEQLIQSMASFGYAPVDFGEGDEEHVELWFDPTAVLLAKEAARLFLETGGGE